jgi:hypothetical protein
MATQITNLTPMDFSFWGFVKDNVYIPPIPVDLQELRDRIVNATALVHVTFLGKLWVELEYRLDVCRITRGSNIEHLKKTWCFKMLCKKLCCDINIRLITIHFQICIPYSVTPYILKDESFLRNLMKFNLSFSGLQWTNKMKVHFLNFDPNDYIQNFNKFNLKKQFHN